MPWRKCVFVSFNVECVWRCACCALSAGSFFLSVFVFAFAFAIFHRCWIFVWHLRRAKTTLLCISYARKNCTCCVAKSNFRIRVWVSALTFLWMIFFTLLTYSYLYQAVNRMNKLHIYIWKKLMKKNRENLWFWKILRFWWWMMNFCWHRFSIVISCFDLFYVYLNL